MSRWVCGPLKQELTTSAAARGDHCLLLPPPAADATEQARPATVTVGDGAVFLLKRKERITVVSSPSSDQHLKMTKDSYVCIKHITVFIGCCCISLYAITIVTLNA